ncbi:MAG: hypothetical protein WBB28_14565 [Crinalium sp.]
MTTSSVSNLIPTLQKIDQIQDTTRLLACVRPPRGGAQASLSLSPELYNGEPTGRNVRWYGIQAEILNDGKSWRTEDATEPIEFWLFLTELKDQYYPEANSATVCQYTPRHPCIPGYKNQPIFSRKVILINLIDKPQKLDRAYISAQFRAENQKVPLNDGDVVAQLIQCYTGDRPSKAKLHLIQQREQAPNLGVRKTVESGRAIRRGSSNAQRLHTPPESRKP